MGTENKDSCSQRDSAEREGYGERTVLPPDMEGKGQCTAGTLGGDTEKGNLNRAFKRVKANKGAPGIDGITVEEIGAYLRENQKELIERIRRGKYTPTR